MISFRPNCTSPTASPAFVGAVNVRSTLDIVWSCLTVLILCTWSIQHLNVPPQSGRGSRWQWIKYQSFLVWRKCKWMALTIIAPEIVFGKALAGLYYARHTQKNLEKFAQDDGVDWSLAHSYFANMGGFVVHFPPKETFNSHAQTNTMSPGTRPESAVHQEHHLPTVASSRRLQRQEEDGPLPLKRFRDTNTSRSIFVGGNLWAPNPENTELVKQAYGRRHEHSLKIDYSDWLHNLKCLQGNIWVLNANQLFYGREQGIIDAIPDISEDELNDKNKSDSVIKLLALIQILWFVLQLIVRRAQDLAASQLEISTLAFAVSSILTYSLAWGQPKEVFYPKKCAAARHATAEEIFELAVRGPETVRLIAGRDHPCIPDSSCNGTPLFSGASIIGSIIFGLVHIISWNYQFPNTMELLFWRISIVVTIALPAVIFLVTLSVTPYAQKFSGWLKFCNWVLYISSFVYALARLFMLVEVFRTLYYLAPSAYRTTWTTNVPHFG